MKTAGLLVRKLWWKLKRLGRRARGSPPTPSSPAQGNAAAADAATSLLSVDPFRPGGPYPAGRCERCIENDYGRPADFERRMAEGLENALGDGAPARWFAAEIAAGRLCEYRVNRILTRAICAIRSGDTFGVKVARIYALGELGRLAVRCGLRA